MSSVARVKSIKSKVIFRYHTKGVSSQVLSNSDVIHVQILVLKWEKKKWENISWLQDEAIRGLYIGESLRDYKSEQVEY